MPHTTSFNDDSWALHGKAKCAIRSQTKLQNIGPHHQGKKTEMAWTCTANGRGQDTKASHTMTNGLMHQKKSRKAEIELD